MRKLCALALLAASPAFAATVNVDASKILRSSDVRRIAGTNIAAWDSADLFKSDFYRQRIRDLSPTFVRIPGGSWGDIGFWNGNGVRKGVDVDWNKFRKDPFSRWSGLNGSWDIDYSSYAPGFNIDLKDNRLADTKWHGWADVKTMHEFVRDTGNEPYVIVNAGTGTPRDAAEWVRWANLKMGYKVKYWEVGNELGGSWEAGHFLPDGSELNGEIYAHRYEEFALAMKAVDPTIKVGCMDWLEDVLKHRGDLVDFLSIHAYPTSGAEQGDELYEKLGAVAREVGAVKALIKKYQPKRASQIEIGYSEWNMGFPDNRGTLWHAAWMGEMLKEGCSFSQQFDLPGMVTPQQDRNTPEWKFLKDKPLFTKSTYWAAWLWRHAMRDGVLGAKVEGAPRIRAYASRSGDQLSLMLLNTDPEKAATVHPRLKGFKAAATARSLRLSRREYFWLNEHEDTRAWEMRNDSLWDRGPRVLTLSAGSLSSIELPPDSLTLLQWSAEGSALATVPVPNVEPLAAGKASLSLHLPSKVYVGDTLEGWAYARQGTGRGAAPALFESAPLESGPLLQADRANVDLNDGAGRFSVRALSAGKATLVLKAGALTSVRKVDVLASIPRPRVFWEFEEAKPTGLRSQWKLSLDPSLRPNQQAARIDLGGDDPSKSKKRELLVIESLPGRDKLPKENVRGAFFDLKTTPDFACSDAGARILVVMQSPRNYWMQIGRVELKGHGDWQTHTLAVEDPKLILAMPEIFNLWFVLEASAPVRGSICIDRAGLLVR